MVCATSATLAYFLSAWTTSLAPIIYGISFAIGLLIGIEIPLATRLNQVFDELRVNVSSVLEYDYYGALLGGVLFAFVALPFLGLTYTPIAVGAINLAVAGLLYARHRRMFAWRRVLSVSFAGVSLFLIALAWLAEPIVLFGEQRKYRDQVIYQDQTRYQRIVMTRFRDHHWLYLDGHTQFSSYDEERYHETARASRHARERGPPSHPGAWRGRRIGAARGAATPRGHGRHPGRHRPGHDHAGALARGAGRAEPAPPSPTRV